MGKAALSRATAARRHCRRRRRPGGGAVPGSVRGALGAGGAAARCRAVSAEPLREEGRLQLEREPRDLPFVSHEASAEPGAEAGAYSWTKQWYPVLVVAHTDAGRPHRVPLLGKDLVVWRDGTGKWRAFEDRCPHRLAPLSEGRVERDGTLACAYHAWRFDGEGRCVALPQAESAARERELCASERACARSHPTRTHHGLLWVWAEGGPEAFVESAVLNPPRLSREYAAIDERGEEASGMRANEWMQRDLPYGWDTFMENAIDPAHACVSHHGLVGSRYTDAVPFRWQTRRDGSDRDGFRLALDPAPPPFNAAGAPAEATCEYDFQPPTHLRFDWDHPRGFGLAIIHNCTPTMPGRCRHFQSTVITREAPGPFAAMPRWFRLNKLSFQPAFWSHLISPSFLHQDLVLLHSQERAVAADGDGWLCACHMPTVTDRSVVLFRRWLERAGGGVGWRLPPGEARRLPPAERNRARLFDTWEAHTMNCVPCQRALLATQAAMVANAAGVLAAAASGNAPAALALAASLYGLDTLRRLFYVYEFSHQDNGDNAWDTFAREVLLKDP